MSTVVETKVYEIFSEMGNADMSSLTKETLIRENTIDSLAFVTMIARLEGEFDIELDDEKLDFSTYENLGDVINLFTECLSDSTGQPERSTDHDA